MPLRRSPVRAGGSAELDGAEEISMPARNEEVEERAVKDSMSAGEVFAAEFRNVRIATFWRNRPKLWFVHLESEFAAYRVRSDDVRYSAIIRHLDEQTMLAVADVLEQPPSQGKFEMLKEALIQRFSVSQEKKLRTLLSAMELNGRTPSTLLREMRTLAGKDVTDGLLRTLWTQRLPQRIQELLAVLDGVGLDKLAACADKAMERYTETEVAAVYEDSTVGPVAVIEERLRKMEQEIAALRVGTSKFRPARRRSRSRGRLVNEGQMKTFCSFHRRFGERAWRCIKPCGATYPLAQKENEGGHQQ